MQSIWSWQGLALALPAAAAGGLEMSGVSLRREQDRGETDESAAGKKSSAEH